MSSARTACTRAPLPPPFTVARALSFPPRFGLFTTSCVEPKASEAARFSADMTATRKKCPSVETRVASCCRGTVEGGLWGRKGARFVRASLRFKALGFFWAGTELKSSLGARVHHKRERQSQPLLSSYPNINLNGHARDTPPRTTPRRRRRTLSISDRKELRRHSRCLRQKLGGLEKSEFEPRLHMDNAPLTHGRRVWK